MTVSSTTSAPSAFSTLSSTTALSILASVSASTVEETNTKIVGAVTQDIQRQLSIKLAALQQAPDSVVTNALQAQINQLTTQQTAITTLTKTSVSNAAILSELQDQLASLQTDAANGNSTSFDADLLAANTDINNLTATQNPPPFQPDQVSSLVGNGLGIAGSGTYDLTTPEGQAAAAAAVSAAQTTVGQVFALTTANELVANNLTNLLSSQIQSAENQQQTLDAADQAAINAETNRLAQQASDQEHLIELNLGGTSAVAKMLAAALNPPQPYTSVFQALQAAVVSNGTQATAPAILSLLT